MKKLALFLVLMMIPCTAFGLEMLTDNALDEVTGQSGVSIAMDDIQIFLNVEKFAYIDCDGYSSNVNYGGTCGSNLGGAFVIQDFQMDTLNINMLGGWGNLAQYYEGKSGLNGGSYTYMVDQYDTQLDDDSQIYNGTAYSVGFTGHDGQMYYRNPGNQTVASWNTTTHVGYLADDWSGSVYVDYRGSLPLCSANCGSVPLFYDYGSTEDYSGCNLVTASTDDDPFNQGLNNYTNTNAVSTASGFHPQAVTIDITAKLPLHTAGFANALDPGSNITIGGVLIGLPTAEFHIQEMHIGDLTFTANITGENQTVRTEGTISRTNAEWCKNSGETFGTIILEGVTFTTLGGWMEIAPTGYSYDTTP